MRVGLRRPAGRRDRRVVVAVTDPKLAFATDNGRYYRDPLDGEAVISVTNAISEWAKPALAPAAAKATAEYIVDHLPAAVRASRTEEARQEFLREAKAHYRTVWENRRDLGSLVHHHAEALVLGTPMPHDERVAPFIDSYREWMDDFGVEIDRDVESAEVTVFGRSRETLRYAGTADLWVNLRHLPKPFDRGRWLIDIKTSLTKPASTVYRDHVLQLAGLRYADVAVLPDGSETPVPEFAGAAILNLRQKASGRQKGYGFVPLPADEMAHMTFLSLLGVAYFAHALDLKPHKPIKAPVLRAVKGVA